MDRIYTQILEEHLSQYEQMAFLAGPRQCGKTTLSQAVLSKYSSLNSKYLNWDLLSDRDTILSDLDSLVSGLPIGALQKALPLLVLDEIHKYKHWKLLLKGLIDTYKSKLSVIVTGSAKLNIFRRGGDSLMGRYFLYRAHPLSVRELMDTNVPDAPISAPLQSFDDMFNSLLLFGGFPEPLEKESTLFSNRWQHLRRQQLLREDIQVFSQIQDLAQLEVLAEILRHQSGNLLNYTSLSKKVRVSDQSIRRWITHLQSLYYCFTIQPWFKNVSKSLLKEPKIFLWDWSLVPDEGQRLENFVASHLLKAVHAWTDLGFGEYELFFLRDIKKHEVDFLICKDKKPWAMIEVKASASQSLSKSLFHFAQQLHPEHVFQIAFDLPYIEQDCFELKVPTIVPARTLLSQLV